MELVDRNQQIGKNLERLRNGMSQEALAKNMREFGHKWSKATVWAVERGDRPLKLTEANDLLRIFGRDSNRDMALLLRDSRNAEVSEAISEARNRLQRFADSCDDAEEYAVKLTHICNQKKTMAELDEDLRDELHYVLKQIGSESLIALCMRITMQVWPDDYDPTESYFWRWYDNKVKTYEFIGDGAIDKESDMNCRYSDLLDSAEYAEYMDGESDDGSNRSV